MKIKYAATVRAHFFLIVFYPPPHTMLQPPPHFFFPHTPHNVSGAICRFCAPDVGRFSKKWARQKHFRSKTLCGVRGKKISNFAKILQKKIPKAMQKKVSAYGLRTANFLCGLINICKQTTYKLHWEKSEYFRRKLCICCAAPYKPCAWLLQTTSPRHGSTFQFLLFQLLD